MKPTAENIIKQIIPTMLSFFGGSQTSLIEMDPYQNNKFFKINNMKFAYP